MAKQTMATLHEIIADKDNTISELEKNLRLARIDRNKFSDERINMITEKTNLELDLKNKTTEFEKVKIEFYSMKKIIGGTAEARSKIDVLKDLLAESEFYHNPMRTRF